MAVEPGRKGSIGDLGHTLSVVSRSSSDGGRDYIEDMSTTRKCAKCGDSQVIPRVRVVCKVEGSNQDIKLRVDAHPEAMVFKQAERAVLTASICGKCGFTEFFVDEPRSLYEAYLESRK
jgi:ribosomal protein S27AE